MAYLIQNNSETILCGLNEQPITGTLEDLLNHPAMATGNFSVIDGNPPVILKSKLIYAEEEL